MPPQTPITPKNAAMLDRLRKSQDAHKFSHGHALILSGKSGNGGAGRGGAGRSGAARLAARGALRIGAGVVTIGCPPQALAENAARMDAIMLDAIQDAAALSALLQDTRINALCLGPGLGQARARELVPAALSAGVKSRPMVLDADALTAFEGDPPALFAMLHEGCVLTPHAGEFARLFPDLAVKLAEGATTGSTCSPTYSPADSPTDTKLDATRHAAARAGCVVVFKGANTVIAAPSGQYVIHSATGDAAAPWLATAGAGDVLAGFITGLLARGFDPMQAAEYAAWLHQACARSFGPGLIAEDLPQELPKVFRSIGV